MGKKAVTGFSLHVVTMRGGQVHAVGVLVLWCLFLVGNCYSEEYVPGQQGGSWTLEEVLAVKSKLYTVFAHNGGYRAMQEIFGDNNGVNWQDVPDAAKMLRLGFHDCLKYADGTGGCDGCLNWHGVGHRFGDGANKWKFEDVGETNNNGLGPTVEVLERIYTDPYFPKGKAPSLNDSLKASGKSRADLWAFATICATEYTIETNNMVCDGTYRDNPAKQCSHSEQGSDECFSLLNSRIKFFTGRRDCSEDIGDKPYKTSKVESHPNAVGNGKMTADFFARDFGFNGRETVAIMGAHTIGRLHYPISLFRYLWTTRTQASLNNDYYKNIVRKDLHAFHDDDCNLITDAEGNVPKTRWVAHVRKDTKNGGPVHWIKENYQCPNCFKDTDNHCCKNQKEGNFCKADSELLEDDADINRGCEHYRFISGLDEMALPCEIGLYFDFNVTDDGIPYGCPGMRFFNQNYFNKSYTMMWSNMPKVGKSGDNLWDREKADPQCPPNKLEYPEGSQPLYEIFEEFASDNQGWVDEFIPALEKMLSNGYASGELTLNPADQYSNVRCPFRPSPWDGNRYTNCYLASEIQDKSPFFLVSRHDGRALQGKWGGFVDMRAVNESDAKQMWVTSQFGQQIINVGTNLPLQAGNGRTWSYNQTEMILKDDRSPHKALTRGWAKKDGVHVVTWDKTKDLIVQLFIKQTREERTGLSGQQKYMIVSKLDTRAMEGTPGGEAVMMEQNASNPAQLWIRKQLENGAEMYVNAKSKLPLFVKANSLWAYDDKMRIVDFKDQKLALDRGWVQKDGDRVGWWKKHGGPNQKFEFKAVF